MTTDGLMDTTVTDRGPHYEPYGWHQWPDAPWFSYQFRRALGETQEGGGAVSECFLAASRMTPDLESWHREWYAVAERNRLRGDRAEAAGHGRRPRTAGCVRSTTTARRSSTWKRRILGGWRPSPSVRSASRRRGGI